jgi:two-component system chemotaxis sensor kinase CheA
MDIDRAELVRLFLSDSEEQLVRLETDALALEERPEGGENVDAMFRVAHTLKGNASILALDGFAKFAHTLEDVLDAVRTRRAPVTSQLVTLLLRSVDALRSMLVSLRAGEPENPGRYKALQEELGARATAAKPQDAVEEMPAAEAAGAAAAPADGRPVLADETYGPALRIEMRRIDQLLDLASRALVVHGQMGTGLLGAAANADLMELHQRSERLLIELQDWVIDTRMVPVSTFFRTHARTVRDAARAQQKRVRLHIEGERVRIDTGIGESAREVLTHLVRNAVDHGIEPPSVRVSRGKHPEGIVTLRAAQNGNQVVIQVSDDGGGLNLAKIRARARAIGRANVDGLGAQELHQLIFEAGFSTAEKVTELSGRGVGMDVVRRNVEALHGTVEVESTEGLGTMIELRLPLSLSVVEGFWVEAGGTDYVLPLDEVVECLDLEADRRPGRDGILNLRGEPVAHVNLRDLLEGGRKTAPTGRIIVVRYRSRQVALGVDTILGQRQTVIKPLGRLFRSAAGISGSSLRPDGGVAFVIDVPRLLRPVARTVGLALETTMVSLPG